MHEYVMICMVVCSGRDIRNSLIGDATMVTRVVHDPLKLQAHFGLLLPHLLLQYKALCFSPLDLPLCFARMIRQISQHRRPIINFLHFGAQSLA